MRNIILFAIGSLFVWNSAKGQTDFCKDIIKKVDKLKNQTSFVSPSMSLFEDIQISKDIGDGTGRPIFDITFTVTKERAAYDYKGIEVKFDDGTIKSLGDDIACSYLNADNHFLFQGGSILHSFDLQLFKTKKIVKFQMADKVVNIPDDFATKLKAWANCIVDMK